MCGSRICRLALLPECLIHGCCRFSTTLQTLSFDFLIPPIKITNTTVVWGAVEKDINSLVCDNKAKMEAFDLPRDTVRNIYRTRLQAVVEAEGDYFAEIAISQ